MIVSKWFCWLCPFLLLLLPNNSYYKHRESGLLYLRKSVLIAYFGSARNIHAHDFVYYWQNLRIGQTPKGFWGLGYKSIPTNKGEHTSSHPRVSEWLSIAAHSLSGSASVKPTWTDNDFHLSFITRTKIDYWEKNKFLQVLDQTRPLYASNITNYD